MDGTSTEEAANPAVEAPDPSAPESSAPGSLWPSRLRRWMRRIGFTMAVTLVVVTVASYTYNAFTDGRAAPPQGLRYVQAADVRTRYQTWGDKGSPVVLVHGAFEQVDTWSKVAPLLARDHRVYALDLT